MPFPKDFLWGTSISAAQAEGAWDEGGKSPVQIDYATAGSAGQGRRIWYRNADGTRGEMGIFQHLPEGAHYETFADLHYPNHQACDFYHHYREDISLFAEMGFSTFNTSISWARIFPHGIQGGVNREGVEFYRSVFQELRAHSIDPVITLYKYDEPVWFEETYGGWDNRQMIDEFVEFARVCFTEFRGLVTKWLTFNEINILLFFGMRNPDPEQARKNFQALHNQIVAAAKAVQLAHEIDPQNQVGCMILSNSAYPLTPDPEDVWASYRQFQESFCYCGDAMVKGHYPRYAERMWQAAGARPQISEEDRAEMEKGKADFIAFSYYSTSVVTTHKDALKTTEGNMSRGIRNPYLPASDWGWQIDPLGFKYTMERIYDHYHVPMFDVENGLGAYDTVTPDGRIHDDYRIDYLRRHIKAMKEAVEDGVELFGYTTWGGLDLVSAGTGQMDKRYGMIYVDMNDKGEGDFHRLRKDSFTWYQKVIASNGEDLD
jgi:6-phospho-beta-glucosidase